MRPDEPAEVLRKLVRERIGAPDDEVVEIRTRFGCGRRHQGEVSVGCDGVQRRADVVEFCIVEGEEGLAGGGEPQLGEEADPSFADGLDDVDGACDVERRVWDDEDPPPGRLHLIVASVRHWILGTK